MDIPPVPTRPAAPPPTPTRTRCQCGLCGGTGKIDLTDPVVRKRFVEEVLTDKRSEFLRLLSRLGKHVVGATAALYVVGFCICVMRYHRAGVPVHALAHTQFIGAAILFLSLVASAFWFGACAAVRPGARGFRRVLLDAAFVLFIAFTAAGFRAALIVTMFWVILALTAWFGTRSGLGPERQRNATEDNPDATRDDSVPKAMTQSLVPTVILIAAFFATVAFPGVPQWLGGGEARRVVLNWATPLTDAESKSVEATGTECAFEVHSDSDHMYLMFVDPADGRCLRAVKGWRDLLAAVGNPFAKTQYMAVKRDRIASVVYR